MPEMLPPAAAEVLTVTRQLIFWFEVDDLEAFRPDRFPFAIWVGETLDQFLCPFPAPFEHTPALKVLTEQYAETTTAETVDRTITQADINTFYDRLVEPRLHGVSRNCIRSAVCLYTNTPDDHFIIDLHPESDRIMVASPCSGHGFKHSAAIGEGLAQWAAGGSPTLDLTPFRFSRVSR